MIAETGLLSVVIRPFGSTLVFSAMRMTSPASACFLVGCRATSGNAFSSSGSVDTRLCLIISPTSGVCLPPKMPVISSDGVCGGTGKNSVVVLVALSLGASMSGPAGIGICMFGVGVGNCVAPVSP